MNRKLLASTALVGSLMLAGSVNAQTSITGSLDIVYKGLSNSKDNVGTQKSQSGFGRESQVNVSNKGKLNTGTDYVAGFSLEFDGNSSGTGTEASTISNENLYIDLIMGTTTFTVGVDHVQNSDNLVTPTAYGNAAGTFDGEHSVAFASAVGANPKESMGLGLMQTIPGAGRLSAYFVPERGDTGNRDTRIGTSGQGSAYEIGFRGDAGVKGLDVKAFYNKGKKADTLSDDPNAVSLGVAYRIGNLAIGFDHLVNDGPTNLDEKKSYNFGLAYNISKDIAVSAHRFSGKIENDPSTAKVKEDGYHLAVGYNLGPVALGASFTRVDNRNFLAANGDVELFTVGLSTNF